MKTQNHLTTTTKPFAGETAPQVWIVQPYAHFSVERGTLGDTWRPRKHLEMYEDRIPEIRLFPVIPGAEIAENIAPVTRGWRPYQNGTTQDPVAPFVLRKRELPECWMIYNAGRVYPSTPYGVNLTPSQSDALSECFAAELAEKVQELIPEIRRRIRQQVADELRKQAAEARKDADTAEAFAAMINH